MWFAVSRVGEQSNALCYQLAQQRTAANGQCKAGAGRSKPRRIFRPNEVQAGSLGAELTRLFGCSGAREPFGFSTVVAWHLLTLACTSRRPVAALHLHLHPFFLYLFPGRERSGRLRLRCSHDGFTSQAELLLLA